MRSVILFFAWMFGRLARVWACPYQTVSADHLRRCASGDFPMAATRGLKRGKFGGRHRRLRGRLAVAAPVQVCTHGAWLDLAAI